MSGGDFGKTVIEALLGFHLGMWDLATSYATQAYVAHATLVQEKQKGIGGDSRSSKCLFLSLWLR